MQKQMHISSIYFAMIFIGFCLLHIKVFANSGPEREVAYEVTDDDFDESKMTGPPNGQGGWVIVEPLNVLTTTNRNEIRLVPYKYRRQRWAHSISFGYSMFSPTNLEPNVGAFVFSDIYDDNADVPLIEVQFNIKRNFSIGSLALELAIGTYSNDSDSDLVESTLEIMPIRVGASFMLDMITDNPYISPYVSGGGYIMQYTESQGSTSFNGTTQVAPYAAAGLQLSLDWLDQSSANTAYIEAGLETTSLYIEGRKFFASSAEADPNFETDFHGNAGLRLEF